MKQNVHHLVRLNRLPNLQPPFNNKHRSKKRKRRIDRNGEKFCSKPITHERLVLSANSPCVGEGIECRRGCRLELRGRDERRCRAEGIGIVASVGHHVCTSNYVLTFSSVTVQVDQRGVALPRSHQRVVQRMLRDPLVVCTSEEWGGEGERRGGRDGGGRDGGGREE